MNVTVKLTIFYALINSAILRQKFLNYSNFPSSFSSEEFKHKSLLLNKYYKSMDSFLVSLYLCCLLFLITPSKHSKEVLLIYIYFLLSTPSNKVYQDLFSGSQDGYCILCLAAV